MNNIYLHLNGQQAGPYTLDDIRRMLAEGKISAETLAWREGMAQWSPVASFIPPAVPADASRPVFVKPQGSSGMNGCVVAAVIVAGLVVVLTVLSVVVGLVMRPKIAELQRANQQRLAGLTDSSEDMTQAALKVQTGYLADVLNRYAGEHDGAYPAGRTSTDVFQKLIDEKYVFDPSVFYTPMKGKTKATGPQLTAANVSFDVTAGATRKSSKFLPLVFTTGYTVTYTAGASAEADTANPSDLKGIAVTYLNGSSKWQANAAQGAAPNFIDPAFDAGGETYQQLKP